MPSHPERHYSDRTGWLRAAVLGANDGIISTASLVIGVAAADIAPADVLVAGVAALVAGTMSMAAGEFVSVSSQADSEKADLHREQQELDSDPDYEHNELAQIYVNRGLESSLAFEVAEQLMKHDALAAHARDELGISDMSTARPIQAAMASALTFAVGGSMPLVALLVTDPAWVLVSVASSTLIFLAILGLFAAYAGGGNRLVSVARVTSWGALAMAFTAIVGKLFDVAA